MRATGSNWINCPNNCSIPRGELAHLRPTSRTNPMSVNETNPVPTFVTIQQGADLFGCHPNTIRNRIKDESLPAVRLGRNIIRINLADLEALFTPYKGGEFGIWS